MAKKEYTVILGYPPSCCEDSETIETFMTSATAATPKGAIWQARLECLDTNEWTREEMNPTDLQVIAVIEGDHQDLKPNPYA